MSFFTESIQRKIFYILTPLLLLAAGFYFQKENPSGTALSNGNEPQTTEPDVSPYD